MNNLTLTDWFPPEVRPVHPGVYELEDLPYPFLYWTGEFWCISAGKNPEEADKDKYVHMKCSDYAEKCRWRGVAK